MDLAGHNPNIGPAEWAIPQPSRFIYTQQFNAIDAARTGYLTGVQAKNVLIQSGLSHQTLAHIWNLSDIDVDGNLSLEEFILASHLMDMAKSGRPLPSVLSSDLVPPSFRKPPVVLPPVVPTIPTAVAPMAPTTILGGPPAPAPAPVWTIPESSKLKYNQVFNTNDRDRTGFLTGAQAQPLMIQSGLPKDALAKIWSLCDVSASGRLNRDEFVLAMHLIDMVKAGAPVPTVLPPNLLPSSQPPIPVGPAPVSVGSRSASITSPSAIQSPAIPWSIPQASVLSYTLQFHAIDTARSGYLTGPQAKNVLITSGLAQQTLAQIWNLSDIDVDGRLSLEEFILASHLIEMAKAGRPLPPTLPPDLIPPSFRKPSVPPARSASISDASASVPSVAAPADPSTLPPGVALSEWAVPQSSKLKYIQIFNTHDRTRAGFLTGVQVRGIMVQSGLPQEVLAKIWALCDVTASGRLNSEEFILAMHLIDMVKSGSAVPTVLPLDLVPPCHRRRRGSSTTSSISSATGVSTGPPAEVNDSPGKVATFEDKRKENFDRGQAVLDRKRQVLLDQQKREQDERERKEREEQAKREKVRLEMERKRQEEIERQMQKQREIEAEKEEARKAELEKREAARRELERQRLIEWETQRINELQNQRQKTIELIAQLKARKTKLAIDAESVNNQYTTAQEALNEARNKVTAGKSVIDSMRTERDAKLREHNLANATKKTLDEKQKFIDRERERIMKELQAEVKMQADQAPIGSDAAKLALQNKQAMIAQLKVQVKEALEDQEKKKKDSEKTAQQLAEVRKELDELKAQLRDLNALYSAKLQEGKDVKEKFIQKQMNFDPNADWGEPTPLPVIVDKQSETTTATQVNQSTGEQNKIEYRVLFDFDATNDDELTLKTGDTVWVVPNSNAEEGWLQGEFNGSIGWFPANYAEPASASSSSAVAQVTADSQSSTNAFDSAVTATAASTSETVTTEATSLPTLEKVTAIYPWNAKQSNQISFKKGDVIKVTEKQDEWWFGELPHGQSGWFPMSFVQSEGTSMQDEYFVTLYQFESQEPGDLAFDVNEVVKVVKKDGDWWTGEITDERVGVFPSNYVRAANPQEIVSFRFSFFLLSENPSSCVILSLFLSPLLSLY